MSLLTWIIIIVVAFILIKTVKFVRIILTVVLGIIYIPINTLNTAVQKWYFHMKKVDQIVYYAFTPIYWLLVGITFIVSAPYEFVITENIH